MKLRLPHWLTFNSNKSKPKAYPGGVGWMMVRFVEFPRRHSLTRHRFLSLLPLLTQSGRKEAVFHTERSFRCFSSVVSEFEHDEPHDEVKTTKKDNALRLALSQLVGEFGRESMSSLQRFFGSRRAPVISTGSLKLDVALGIGGLPKGRIVEIYGREASGKTTLALHVIKEAQKLGGYCAYLDVENAIDSSLIEAIGIDTKDLLISHPDSAENLLCVVDTLTKSGSVDVIVVDSVAALVPQCEIDVPIGGMDCDMQSRIMTQALRKIHQSLSRSHTLVIFLNQVRASVNSDQIFGGTDEVTCGGNALKFYSAVRLRMMRKELLKSGDKVMGLGVTVQVTKNKLAPVMKKADLRIEFGRGFQYETEILELASEYGVIIKEGNNYIIGGQVLSTTCEAEQYLIENHEVLEKIVSVLREQLFERKL